MAGYHYKLDIIPCSYVDLEFEEKDFWKNENPNPEMLERFRSLLPDKNHWGETEEFRSKNNYSVLYIWWEDDKVWNIHFEYAPVCEGRDELLNGVLSLCKEYGYKLHSERSGAVIEPSKEALWSDFVEGHPYSIYERRGLGEFQ